MENFRGNLVAPPTRGYLYVFVNGEKLLPGMEGVGAYQRDGARQDMEGVASLEDASCQFVDDRVDTFDGYLALFTQGGKLVGELVVG